VNNSAVGENSAGGRPASARSRSYRSDPQRIKGRLPGEPEALAKTSNRTKPQEGQLYQLDGWQGKGTTTSIKHITAMSSPSDQESVGWLESRFGALDWASEKHSVVVVDPQGKVLEDFEIEHSALGWKKFRKRMRPYGSIPFAIETSQGAAVEQLLEAGMHVYPLNPKSAQAYRERKAPSGVKDDQLDAWSFADALRVDGQNWKPLRPEGSLIKELRLLCRDEVGLIEGCF
jgi:Transposase